MVTRRRGTSCETDPSIQALVRAETPVVTIFGKTSPLHVREVLQTTLDENLKMIGDTVRQELFADEDPLGQPLQIPVRGTEKPTACVHSRAPGSHGCTLRSNERASYRRAVVRAPR